MDALSRAGAPNMHRLSQTTGLSYWNLRRWQQGTSVPSREHLAQLAGALGVSVRWLEIGEHEDAPAPAPTGTDE